MKKTKVVKKKKEITKEKKRVEVKIGNVYKFEILNYSNEVMEHGVVTVLEYDSEIDKYWTVDKKGSKRFLEKSEFIEQVK